MLVSLECATVSGVVPCSGGKTSLPDSKKMLPIHYAMQRQHTECIQLLQVCYGVLHLRMWAGGCARGRVGVHVGGWVCMWAGAGLCVCADSMCIYICVCASVRVGVKCGMMHVCVFLLLETECRVGLSSSFLPSSLHPPDKGQPEFLSAV